MTSLCMTTTSYGPGQISEIGGLADTDLQHQLRRYKRMIAKRYRVIPAEKAETILPEGELLVSTKLDGQLWFLIVRDGSAAFCSPSGRVLQGIPLSERLAENIGNIDVIIAGELYVDGSKDWPRVGHVAAILGDGARADELRFAAFDLLEDGEQDALALPYLRRLERLQQLLEASQVITTEVVERAEVPRLYRDWVLSGRHEGLVARSEQGLTYKIKPTISLDLVVVAFGSRIEGEQHELREMTVALLDDEGHYQVIGSVGTGFSAADRLSWHHRLSGIVVPSAYRLAGSDGTMCRFVQPEIVVEVICSDLLTHDSSGNAIRRMRLAHSSDGYRPLGEYPTGALLHPRFDRERDDKQVVAGDVGLEQITSRVLPEEEATGNTRAMELPKAEILARKVWTKVTKGKQMVRKYVLVKTNKEQHIPCSPYALFSTDYSPNRAEPLKTGLSVAVDREQADAQVEKWLSENIKKGWEEV